MTAATKLGLRHDRRCLIAVILGLGTFLTGCHHSAKSTQPVYAPPTLSSNSGGSAPIVRRKPAVPEVETPPANPLAEPEGKPISTEIGLASWYGPPYHNRQAADGSIFDQNALTVAHRTLPMGTIVRVTNVATGDSVVAKVTDRGPFIHGRTLDLSLAAAKAIGVYRAGVAQVKIEAYAKPNADPEGRWCVQIGAFLDPADSIQLKNDLMSRYKTAKVIEFTGPTGHWVRINPVPADKSSAARIADSIHIPDAEPFLVRLN